MLKKGETRADLKNNELHNAKKYRRNYKSIDFNRFNKIAANEKIEVKQ